MVIKKPDFLKRLDSKAYFRFWLDLLELCQSAALETDAVSAHALIASAEEALGLSRANPYTESRRDVVKMMRDTTAVLGSALAHYQDDNEKLAYSIYRNVLCRNSHLGMRKYVEAVSVFLAGLGDMEFDDLVASKISTLRILVSRYSSVEANRMAERDAIKARKKVKLYRAQLQEMVIKIGAKLMLADESGGTTYSVSFNNMLDDYRSLLPKKRKPKEEDSKIDKPADDAQG